MNETKSIIPSERVRDNIHTIRGQRVMLDAAIRKLMTPAPRPRKPVGFSK